MSAESHIASDDWIPNPNDPEHLRFRREDPEFAVDLAKARAKALGQTYSPERHGPFEAKIPPRQERRKQREATPISGDLDAIIKRFEKRAPGVRHLQAVPNAEREGVRRVRDL